MKKIMGLFLCLFFAAFSSYAWDIVKDGKAQAVIVIPQSSYPAEKYAAEELQYILKKATGAELQISTQSGSGMKAIRLGRAAGLDLKGLPTAGFRIQTTDDALLLAGRDTDGVLKRLQTATGTLYAVYEWAERELQVRWLWPNELGEVIPARSTVPAGKYDLRQKPALQFSLVRGFDWRWNRRLLRADLSSYIQYVGCPSQGHAFGDWVKRYGKEHPDYFEMDASGIRHNDRYSSMCVSNPKFHQQIVDNWKKAGAPNLAVNAKENDAYGRCLCERCRSWDGEDIRWPSAYYAGQRNVGERYARYYKAVWELASKINPDVQVGGYAYMNYVYAPRKTKLNKNIFIGFVDDLPFPRTKKYQKMVDDEIDAWLASGATIYLRPNYFHSSYCMPELFYNQYAHEFKTAIRKGAVGFDVDGPNNSWATVGVNLYVMSRLVVNPERPVEELIDEYCSAFGKAAPAVRRYIAYWEKYTMDHADYFNYVHENKSERKWFQYGFHYTSVAHLLFPEKCFKPAEPILKEAEKLAKGDDLAEKRVRFLRQGFDHAILCSRACAVFADPKKDNVARQRAQEKVREFRKTIGPDVAAVKFFTSRSKMMEGKAWRLRDVDLSEALALPEMWQVKVDSSENGRKAGYFKADYADGNWQKASTWGFLDDQVNSYRTAWYRTTFTMPKLKGPRKIVLRLGAIDESGWIWVNGRKAGELIYNFKKNPNSWNMPFELDVTGLVKPGAENQVTVMVENTIGKGGLWQPSYLRFERIGKGAVNINLPRRRGYAEQVKAQDGTAMFKMTGHPERGAKNAWATAVVPINCKNPAGKVFRLKAQVKIENLTKGEFRLMIREVSSAKKTLVYDGFVLKNDCDWMPLEKDITIRNNAASIALFAIGANMPAGSVALLKDVSVEEMQ